MRIAGDGVFLGGGGNMKRDREKGGKCERKKKIGAKKKEEWGKEMVSMGQRKGKNGSRKRKEKGRKGRKRKMGKKENKWSVEGYLI